MKILGLLVAAKEIATEQVTYSVIFTGYVANMDFPGPTGVYLLDFFCSGIQFYLLLSPYLCFITLLYLDLYILGDDASTSYGSFMQTKYLCVLIHI